MEKCTRDGGRKGKPREKGDSSSLRGVTTQASGKKTNLRDKESTNSKTEKDTKDNGRMTSTTEEESKCGRMERSTRDCTVRERDTGGDVIVIETELWKKESGSGTNWSRGAQSGQMGGSTVGRSERERERATEN